MDSRIINSMTRILAQDGGSFYFYERETRDRKAEELLTKFTGYSFLYSIKTNPFPDVVQYILGKGFGADAASAAEVNLAVSLGAKPENISYSAPGKTRSDIEATIGKCTIIADSYSEINLINAIAKEKNVRLPIGVRVNPDFSMFKDTGESSKFGIDEETLIANKNMLRSCSSVSIVGIHVHLRSQVLDESALVRYYRRIFEKAAYFKTHFDWNIAFINFGGGLGIPYSAAKDKPLDISGLGNKCLETMMEYDTLHGTKLMIETGRYLICEAGWYVTPIVDCKQSRGTKYIIVQNGLNGFLRPSLAVLLKNAAMSDLANFSAEPLFTKMDAFDFTILGKEDHVRSEIVTIAGNLCTATDVLASDIMLPKADIGDYVVVSKAGSYAYSLSPVLFSSQPGPKQVLI